jgi:hypothetical protein
MFLGLRDPDPLVRGMDPDPAQVLGGGGGFPFSHEGVGRIEIMLAK